METLTRNSLRLVHVDDDSDFAAISARKLKRAGFVQPVVYWPDGIRALHYFSQIELPSAPHVILLDLQMPEMNGLDILLWIRENYSTRDTPVYLLTSSEDPEHRRLAASRGVTEFLIKSSSLDELIERLDKEIAISNGRKQEAGPEIQVIVEISLPVSNAVFTGTNNHLIL